MTRHVAILVGLAGCGVPAPSTSDAPLAHPDAPECALHAEVTGSAGTFTFTAITKATYKPWTSPPPGYEPTPANDSAFVLSDASGLALAHAHGAWGLFLGQADTTPKYKATGRFPLATPSEGCTIVTFDVVFETCGATCAPAGEIAGSVRIGA